MIRWLSESAEICERSAALLLCSAVACWTWLPTLEPSFSTSTRRPTIATSSAPSTGIQARPRTMRSSRGGCSRSARRGRLLSADAPSRSGAVRVRRGASSRRGRAAREPHGAGRTEPARARLERRGGGGGATRRAHVVAGTLGGRRLRLCWCARLTGPETRRGVLGA